MRLGGRKCFMIPPVLSGKPHNKIKIKKKKKKKKNRGKK